MAGKRVRDGKRLRDGKRVRGGVRGGGGDAEGEGGSQSRAFVRAIPALLIFVGVLFDMLSPPRFTAGPLFTAAPLIAAPFYALRNTVLIGGASLLAVLGLQISSGTVGSVESTTELLTVLTGTLIAILVNRVVRRSGRELADAREIAEAAQRAVLPKPADHIGGFDVAARYEAAQTDALIGGDLYAVQDTPQGVRLIVGDVRGKGLGAVEAVAVVIGAFREAAEQEISLEKVAQRLERALAREGTRREGLDQFEGFTTAVLAEIPHDSEIVRVINRGHPEPLMLHADGVLKVLAPAEPALPLGMDDLGFWPDRAEVTAFPRGATLLLYTDGLSEARDERGVFYDPAARLKGRTFAAPDGLLASVSAEVRLHTGGGTTDDMALLAVRRP